MELIKDFGEFKTQGQVFIANIKEAWNHATRLAVSAIAHYQETKNAEMVDHLLNVFAEANGPYLSCFEKALYATTNLKIRQNETDLDSAIFTKSKGNLPEGAHTILETIKSEGLRRYEGKAKTKQKAASWNNDGQRKPRETQSTGADVTNLKTTDFGKNLIDAAKAAENMTPEQRKQAEELAKKLDAGMQAILAGEQPEELTAPASTGGSSLAGVLRAMTSEQSEKMAEAIKMLDDVARVRGSDAVAKTIESFHKIAEGMHAKVAEALTALAKVEDLPELDEAV